MTRPFVKMLDRVFSLFREPGSTFLLALSRVRASAQGRVAHVSLVGLVGLIPFFGGPEAPDKSIAQFVALFLAQDVAGIQQMIHPDVKDDKEIQAREVESFLKRFPAKSFKVEKSVIDSRFRSEDGKTERVQATLQFIGPSLAPQYPDPSTLVMKLLWVLDDGKWWLERPLSINYQVTSSDRFPTAAQSEIATRFEAATRILDSLGLPGTEDLEFVEPPTAGTAVELYKQLDLLYRTEKGSGGVDPDARGVQVMLQAATKRHGGFLKIYHGDFKSGPDDTRSQVPWEMFRDYADAAIKHAKFFERRDNPKRAQVVCRRLISLGRQFLDEPGGLQFMVWGLTFQKQGCQELAKLLRSDAALPKDKVQKVANLASRRIDLVQTALGCLDEMADYGALKTALSVLDRPGDDLFKPWAINTLAIFALKGAPANPETLKTASIMVLVTNPEMQKTASDALDKLGSEPSGAMKRFIGAQKEWVLQHKVYGSVRSFQ